MTGKFAILVGNGFTKDFLKYHGNEFDSSMPLWNFSNELISYNTYIDFMPSIKNELINSKKDDFLQIEKFIRKYGKYGNNEKEFGHLRQFLALSYSELQLQTDKYTYENWKWFNWLDTNKTNLIGAISLNYDLTLERALQKTKTAFFRSGTIERREGIPVLKPHGSIDFDFNNPNKLVYLGDIPLYKHYKFRLERLTTLRNDFGPLNVLKKQELLFPRFEADIIPPSMGNFQLDLRWVKQQQIDFLNFSKSIEKFVIVGSSYWDVDRPEIDFYLNNLSKKCKVYISCDKLPVPLIKKVYSLGLEHQVFNFKKVPW